MTQNQLDISSKTEFAEYSTSAPTTVRGMVTITAPSIETEKERSGIDIVCTIDESGSMGGDKITLLKKTLHHVIDVLQGIDNFGIVTFHTYVTEALALIKMNESGKKRAHDIVDSLQAKDCTNISGGISQSIVTMSKLKEKNPVRCILLLTDGHANEGETSVEGISRMIEKMKCEHCSQSPFSLHTFGFGSDHSVEMLQQLATMNGGIYSFIEGTDHIGKIFANTLGGLISCVASNVVLTLESTENVVIDKIRTGYTMETVEEGKKYAISLFDLQEEEKRDIIFEATFKEEAIQDTPDALVLKSALKYTSVADGKNDEVNLGHLVFVDRNVTPKSDQIADKDFLKELYRLETIESMKKASELADMGNYQGANQVFAEFSKQAERELDGDELEEMMSDIGNIASNYAQSNYLNGGMYRMQASRMAQEKQRSVGLTNDVSAKYTTNMKKKIMKIFK